MPIEDDDPVITSYNVFISPQPVLDPTKPSPKLYVLQYPSHRPQTRPYTSSRSQKPTSLRIKPETGIFEIDIPLFTSENYNSSKGHEYGKAMHDAKQHNPYTSHGLSGGFSQNPPSHPQSVTLSDVPAHNGDSNNSTPTQQLTKQVLGGKVAPTSDRNPVYMLASMNSKTKEMHLSHVDAVVQLRPQLHHIDALEDQKRRADATNRFKHPANSNPTDVGPSSAPVKLETKAIEMKVKDASKEDPNRSLNVNAKLLREIQADRWLQHDWIEPPTDNDDDDGESTNETYNPPIRIRSTSQQELSTSHRNDPVSASNPPSHPYTRLKSALDNDEWLNKMSSPGIELRTRLKGRDRERARRKRQERLRAAKADGAGNTATPAGGNTAVGTGSGSGSAAAATTTTNTSGAGAGAGTGAVNRAGERIAGSSSALGTVTGPFADGSASETASASGSSDDEDLDREQAEIEADDDMAVDDGSTSQEQGARDGSASRSQTQSQAQSQAQARRQQQQQHPAAESPRVKIKKESSALAPATATAPTAIEGEGAAEAEAEAEGEEKTTTATATATATPTAKRRGRPPKK